MKLFCTAIAFLMAGTSLFAQLPAFSWATNVGGNDRESVAEITCDSNDDIIVCGYYESTSIDFDPGADTSLHSTNGGNDIFVTKMDENGNHIWTVSIGGSGEDYAYDVDVDEYDNIYIVGRFQNTVDFDPSPGTHLVTWAGGFGIGGDIYVLKLTSDGLLDWVYATGAASGDAAYSLTVDPNNNPVITGSYNGTVEFNPIGGATLTTPTTQDEIFILKLNEFGDFVWVKSIGGTQGGGEIATGIESDNFGNLFITGEFDFTVDFNPGPGVNALTPAVGNDGRFILKLDSAGEYEWAHGFIHQLNDYRHNEIEVDNNGDVILIGKFIGTVDFDPSSSDLLLTSSGSFDGFVQKISSDGLLLWAAQLDSKGLHSIDSGPDNSLYITGEFDYTNDFDPGVNDTLVSAIGSSKDFYIWSLSSNGEFNFVLTTGSNSSEPGEAVALNSKGGLVISGQYSQLLDLDPTPGLFFSTVDAGSTDMFVMSLQLPDVNCTASSVPGNFMANVSASTVAFNWDAVPTSVGCRLTGGPVGSGFIASKVMPGFEVNSSAISTSGLTPGVYEARVQCACSIAPLLPTQFSTPASFTIPEARIAPEIDVLVAPSPATDRLIVKFTAETVYSIIISDNLGRIYQRLEGLPGSAQREIDLAKYPSGTYFLEINLSNGSRKIQQFIVRN